MNDRLTNLRILISQYVGAISNKVDFCLLFTNQGRWSGGFQIEHSHIDNMCVEYKDNIVMEQDISTIQLVVSLSNIDQSLHTKTSDFFLDLKLFSRGRRS